MSEISREVGIFDKDDTSANTAAAFAAYVEQLMPGQYPINQLLVGRLPDDAPEELKIVRKQFFKDPDVLLAIQPRPGAENAYRELSRFGDLMVLSGRDRDIEWISRQWYEQTGLAKYVKEISHCGGNPESERVSAKCVAHIGMHATYSVEDDEQIAPRLARFGIFVCLITQPWNRHIKQGPNLRRFDSLDELAIDVSGLSSFRELIDIHRQDYPPQRHNRVFIVHNPNLVSPLNLSSQRV